MKKFGKVELFTVALGSVIGWGAFMLPGSFFLEHAGVINTVIGFLIAIFMIAIIEKNYSLLMTKYNAIGGEYTYATEEFGDKIGFFTGWLLLLAYVSIIPLNATAVPMVFEKVIPIYSKGQLLYSIADFSVYLNDLILSLIFILLFAMLQLKGLNYSVRIQNLTVFVLLICVVFLFFITILTASPEQKLNFNSNLGTINYEAIIRIIAFAPWAFIGFDTVAQVSSESKVSPKTASLMALVAVIFGGLVYNALNVVTAFGVPNTALAADSWATGDAVYNIMGSSALLIIGLAMFGAVLSGLNGFFMSSVRLTLAMANSYSPSNQNIRKIIFFITVVSLIVPFFGRNALFWFVDVSSVGASFAYLITSLAAFKVSKRMTDRLVSILGGISSLCFLMFLLTPIFGSNIPVISIYVILIWLIMGSIVFLSKKTSFQYTRNNSNYR